MTYTSTTQRASLFCDQPNELLHHISSHIDSPKDLLSLSLTSKQLNDMIIPGHIQFRLLRCDLRHIQVWKKLAELPAVAARFVSLEVIMEDEDALTDLGELGLILPTSLLGSMGSCDDTPTWPPSYEWLDDDAPSKCSHSFEANCVEALIGALRCMANLKCFRWVIHSLRPTNELFAALRDSCPSLKEVEILNRDDLLNQDTVDMINSPLWDLSNLTKFSFKHYDLTISYSVAFECANRMFDMLNRCHNLEDLQLIFYHKDYIYVPYLLEESCWPQLKRLSLGGGRYDSVRIIPSRSFAGFLKRHRTLERLYIREVDHSLVVRHLHNLRALDITGRDICEAIPSRVANHLEYLSLVNLTLLNRRKDQLRFVAKMPSLRFLGIEDPHLGELLNDLPPAIPHIERLHFSSEVDRYNFPHAGKFGSWKSFTKTDLGVNGDPLFVKCCHFLSRLPRLTHLSGFIHLRTVSRRYPLSEYTAAMELAVEGVARACPTLQYLQVDGEYNLWVTINRNADGTYKGWSTTTKLRGVRFEDWGGLYIGTTGDEY